MLLSLCRKCSPHISSASSPLEDDEGHEADHHRCQDGAVDRDEFVVQTIVHLLLGVIINGGRSCCGAIENLGWQSHGRNISGEV